MSEPFEVAAAKLSLAIADVQDEMAKIWDDTLGRLVGPSKLPGWANRRREDAHRALARWPESMGGTMPDDVFEIWLAGPR